VEYTPLNVHFHWMWSFSSSLKLMFFIRLQSLINSTSCSLELMWRATPIHLLFHNSFSTVLYLKHASLYRFGAKSMAWIHSTIYRARIMSFSRFLKNIVMEAQKRALSSSSHDRSFLSMVSHHSSSDTNTTTAGGLFQNGKGRGYLGLLAPLACTPCSI
jgi:hypothetical protein